MENIEMVRRDDMTTLRKAVLSCTVHEALHPPGIPASLSLDRLYNMSKN